MKTSGPTPPAPKFELRLNWKIALFSVLFLPLLLGLGTWQLERAEEKRNIQESWRAGQALAPVSYADLALDEPSAFRRVTVTGRFDSEHYWLLENRVLGGQLGYEVVMPFRAEESGEAPPVVLVNRGWVAAGAYRDQLPEVPTPEGRVRITGNLVEPSDNRFISDRPDQGGWPGKVLEIAPTTLGAQLREAGYQTLPYHRVLQIDPESTGALRTDWRPVNMSPAKHQGYAVQWYSMALVLVVLTIFANTNLADLLFRRPRNQP